MGGDLPILLAWRKQNAAAKCRSAHGGIPPNARYRFAERQRAALPEFDPGSTRSAVATVDSLKAQGADFDQSVPVISMTRIWLRRLRRRG